MAVLTAFNDTVAARTRAVSQILISPELLALFKAQGGLVEDLEHIRDAGLRAETLNQAQTDQQALGKAGTKTVLERFGALQNEYGRVMAVLEATRLDLARSGGPTELLSAVDQILRNETQVHIVSTPSADDTAAARKAKKALSQEAVRAEIQKDAAALVALEAAHAALAKRLVDKARLMKLAEEAAALSGHLAERAERKGAAKLASAAEREAVKAQKEHWGAIYRILAAVGRADARVGVLLGEAKRR